MQVFQTAGVPPNLGRIILAIIGCTRKSNVALRKSVVAKTSGKGTPPKQAIAKTSRIHHHKMSLGEWAGKNETTGQLPSIGSLPSRRSRFFGTSHSFRHHDVGQVELL